MNAPLMPGRIIAQMAITPHKKINQSASGVATGIRFTMKAAITIPAIKLIAVRLDQFFTPLPTTRIDAAMRPKKRLHVKTG